MSWEQRNALVEDFVKDRKLKFSKFKALVDMDVKTAHWLLRESIPRNRLTKNMCRYLLHKKCPGVIHMIPKSFMTPKMCMNAFACRLDIDVVPEELRTPDFCAKAVALKAANLAGVPKYVKIPELSWAAIMINPEMIHHTRDWNEFCVWVMMNKKTEMMEMM